MFQLSASHYIERNNRTVNLNSYQILTVILYLINKPLSYLVQGGVHIDIPHKTQGNLIKLFYKKDKNR